MAYDGLRLQAAYEERVAAAPPEPLPYDLAEWLSALDNGPLVFVANRLLDMPKRHGWPSRLAAQEGILHWRDTATDDRESRLGLAFLRRCMTVDAFRVTLAAQYPPLPSEPVVDGRMAVEIADDDECPTEVYDPPTEDDA